MRYTEFKSEIIEFENEGVPGNMMEDYMAQAPRWWKHRGACFMETKGI